MSSKVFVKNIEIFNRTSGDMTASFEVDNKCKEAETTIRECLFIKAIMRHKINILT